MGPKIQFQYNSGKTSKSQRHGSGKYTPLDGEMFWRYFKQVKFFIYICIKFPFHILFLQLSIFRYIEIMQETKSILGETKSTQIYLANRLNTTIEAVNEMCLKTPALKTIRVTKVCLLYLNFIFFIWLKHKSTMGIFNFDIDHNGNLWVLSPPPPNLCEFQWYNFTLTSSYWFIVLYYFPK